MAGAVITHLRHGEYPNVMVNLVFLTLILSVVYGFVTLVPARAPVRDARPLNQQ